jgi:hypothetical protein
MALAKAAAAAGEDAHAKPFLIDADEMVSYLDTPSKGQLIADWFALSPGFEAGSKLALALGAGARRAERRLVAMWATKLTKSERTKLLMQLCALAYDASVWMEDIAGDEVDEDEIVAKLADRVKAASRGGDRKDLARTIAALRPRQASAQQAVGQLTLWLLEQGKHTDDETAAILFPALGTQHRVGVKLSVAITAADDLWSRFRWGRRRLR